MRKLMTSSIAESLRDFPELVYLGEDVEHGGYYLVTEGLAQKFPGRVRSVHTCAPQRFAAPQHVMGECMNTSAMECTSDGADNGGEGGPSADYTLRAPPPTPQPPPWLSHQVRDMPPDETSLLGVGLGLAQGGLLPVVELPYAKYLDCGADMFHEIVALQWLSNAPGKKVGVEVRRRER